MENSQEKRTHFFKSLFLRLGVLPILLTAAVIIFSLMSGHFLTERNLVNLLRQSVYLILVSLGQMLALVTGGFDLSVGTILAVTSVVSAMVISHMISSNPEAVWTAIVIGSLCGIVAGMTVGLINGAGIAFIGVSPFIMTLGMQSVGFGLALYLTGGVPVSGLPAEFGNTFGFGSAFGIPIPVAVTLICIVFFYVLMNRTVIGNYLLAVGGNAKAAALSGVNVKFSLIIAYLLCALVSAVSGILLTARMGSGESTIGGTVALESIAACVIGGVSLRGGIGRVENVVLGAIFIRLVENGMDLADVGSYLQMVVLGILLIIAVVGDQVRHRIITGESR
jgi:ribose transport system permease protein